VIQLPTDGDLVGLAAGTYPPYAPGVAPFCKSFDGAMQVFLTTRADGLNQFAIEGTHDPIGWAFDFLALDIVDHPNVKHPALGLVHLGFYNLMQSVLPAITEVAQKGPFSICGHSLGAAEALLIGAQLISDGLPPVKIGAFAPPRVGGATFVKIATSVPFCAYRFNVDPVPEVPLTITPDFPYLQVPLTALPGPSIPLFDIQRRVGCHNISNYVAGVKGFAA
jgi:Lipase (class 3)